MLGVFYLDNSVGFFFWFTMTPLQKAVMAVRYNGHWSTTHIKKSLKIPKGQSESVNQASFNGRVHFIIREFCKMWTLKRILWPKFHCSLTSFIFLTYFIYVHLSLRIIF